MKIEFFLHLSLINAFTFSPLTSASTTSHVLTSDSQILKNASVNTNSVSSPTYLEGALKDSDSLFDQVEDGVGESLSLGLQRDGLPEDDMKISKLKSRFRIFKIKPEYLRRPYISKLNDRSNRLNTPIYHSYHNFNNFLKLFDYKLKKREPYLDPNYPDFYHRSRYTDYGRHIYHPYFHFNRGTPERFMSRRKILDNFMFGNQERYPENEGVPRFPGANLNLFPNNSQTSLVTPSTAHMLEQNFATESDYVSENETELTPFFQKAPSDKSKTEPGILSVSTLKPGNLFVLPKYFTRAQNSIISNQSLTGTEKEVSDSDFEALDLPKLVKNESSKMPPSGEMQESFEPSNLMDRFKMGNPLTSKRVYYEKMPQNQNLSWFVYVNCTRDQCHFTNSTNETELMNEGWMMHNCTNYGCTEMYPKVESIQKFIGLILLVFSICVLKIIVFVLLFYYCRHIKLSKLSSENQNSFTWEEEKSDLPFDKVENEKYIGKETSSKNITKQVNDSEFTLSEQNADNSCVLRRLDKDDSKVWTPPDQRVSSCFVPLTSAGKILIPKKTSQKKATPNVRTSDILFKNKGRNRSGIPRLEKLMKKRAKSDDRLGVIKGRDKTPPNLPTKCDKPYIGKDGELLLMDLDEEISSNSMNSACSIEKSPSWEATLKQESPSFISLNLNDEEPSGK